MSLPDVSGLDLQKRVASNPASLPIIFITGHEDIPTAVQAMKAGAVEFLTKPLQQDALLDAIANALDLSLARFSDDAELADLRSRYDSLTPREVQVLALVVAGRLNKQVAGELGISEITVKAHRGKVMRKMKARSLADLVKMAAKIGIGADPALRPFPATFLGSSEVTLAELALAYTVFPNNGSPSPEPFVLERIEEKNGGIVWQSERDKTRHSVMKPETAYEVHSCLVDALDKGTGAAARKNFGLGQFPAAGKTGTAYDFTEALFVGYDNAITCAVRVAPKARAHSP